MRPEVSRFSPGLLGALGLTLAGFGALAAGSAGGFGHVDWAVATTIAAVSLAGMIGLAARWVRIPRASLPHAAVLAALLASTCLLAVNTIVQAARTGALPATVEARASEDLDQRADRLGLEFSELLNALAAPLEAARGSIASESGDPFETLDRIEGQVDFTREGRGLALYGADGSVLAWMGTSYPIPSSMMDGLEEGRVSYRATAESHLMRLHALLPEGRRILVSEVTVYSRLDDRMLSLTLPSIEEDRSARLRLQDFRTESAGFDAHLARHHDRYTGISGAEAGLLFVGMRGPDRSFLGYVRLRGTGASEMARQIDRTHNRIAAALVALLAIGLGWPLLAAGRLTAGLAALWGGRVALSWFPVHALAGESPLFDSSVFASVSLFDLLRSPGDLLLTAACLMVTAFAINRACCRAVRSGPASQPARIGSIAGILALVAGSISALPALAEGLAANAAVNLLAIDLFPPSAPTLVIQIATLLVLLALVLLLQGLVILAGSAGGPLGLLSRLSFRPEDGLSRVVLRSVLPGVALACLLFEPLLMPASENAMESLFENVLMPEVAGQGQAREAMVRATLDALDAMPDLPDRIAAGEDRTGAAMALDIWLETPLAESGYNASLLIHDANGAVISRFARNFPPAFDSRAPEDHPSGDSQPMVERVAFLDITKTILHAHKEILVGHRVVGAVTVHLLDEFDNVPFLTPETPYVRALASQARRVVGLPPFSRGVRHTVYQPDTAPVFSNQREAPTLPPGYHQILLAPGTSVWGDTREEEIPTRTLFFSDGRHLFALGFPRSSGLEHVARSVRVLVLGMAAMAVILVPLLLARARFEPAGSWRRLVESLGRTHYRRLFTTFALATLIPLFGISILMSEFISAEIDADVEERGRQGIQSAGSLMRTILETEEQTVVIDDILYWLSLLVRDDVNLYVDGEIAATSRRELFSSGLLSPRVDGQVYREIVPEGHRFAMGRQRLRGYEYRTISAPLVAGEPRLRGLLTLPLDAQAAEAARRAHEITDVLLITFVAMVLLMGLVGYLVAHRVSRPIRSLSAATARIAGGDFDATVEERPRDETGDLIAAFNRMARSIKEQREDLERRRDYIEKVLLNATIGVISTDREGMVITTNPAAASILEMSGLAPGVDLGALLAERPALEPLARAMKAPDPARPRDVELSVPGSAPDRTVRARVLMFMEGERVLLLLEDVTETVRSNRLAAWAEMARRIAHEIKNPLTPIQLSAEHIRRVRAEGGDGFDSVLEECLQTIMTEVGKLRQISGEFSTYARIPTPRRETVEMSVLLQEVIRPYRNAMPDGIDLELDVPPDLPALELDRSLVSRALVNLIENALQAMPRGGTLTMRARGTGSGVRVEIADTGVGMDAAALGRIFEPYFSTKDAGTGLGLAIARKAIEEHGGSIEARSKPGTGTTMRITLPLRRGSGVSGPVETSAGREE